MFVCVDQLGVSNARVLTVFIYLALPRPAVFTDVDYSGAYCCNAALLPKLAKIPETLPQNGKVRQGRGEGKPHDSTHLCRSSRQLNQRENT